MILGEMDFVFFKKLLNSLKMETTLRCVDLPVFKNLEVTLRII